MGPTGALPPRRVSRAAGRRALRRGRGQDRGGVSGGVSAGSPERPARRAPDGPDPRIHRGFACSRRAGQGGERPNSPNDPRGVRMTEPAWGVDSEHGRLLDVLVCRPENFRWLPTSAITRATLEAGYQFNAELAAQQHAEMVSAYEGAGVRCHYLDPDPALPYQVFARDSSAMGPNGTVITQL